ncbi:hypothetical protein CPHO_09640 [Corynebacterium phocae]|uniref:TIGR03089 family protein n=1 Tax=Corynebacterium phocae TaxID=161895 RepID=A0A1L7D4J8_9CORY|nr:TIGR03089 family protein [Corynebacterium phocae]APT93106.1 hypothetical protein CPHO_09640 [Corynebacterium phocae]KAA8722410.1 TIGR03089 family protein [Corynebacterium phocae]
MMMLQHLLDHDAAAPRLTVYTESTGARMDFSAQTLDNWASKIANMLEEELDLAAGDNILIDFPASWQAAVVALGATAAGIEYSFSPCDSASVVFSSPDKTDQHPGADVVVLTDDPFGRGVAETGGVLPAGAIDFGPTVRFYGDQYYGTTQPLPELFPHAGKPERLLSTGWCSREDFHNAVMHPLAAGGSAVVVCGLVSSERLEEIASAEKVTRRAV